ncbi:hypothetical protein ACHOLT_01280 [Desulfitobacterium sp. Sab5]|uniref:hypothetical protein n=1 Tax=Desulfitobacterium nosdiversum TaxID=3375356 RepID=UPI003CF70CD8
MKYKIWNGTDSLITPVGEVLTADQVKERYPASAVQGMKYIIGDAPISLGVFMEFSQTKEHYKTQYGLALTDNMTDQEVLDAIAYFEENPPVPDPTAEERMAAAMEFQNLLAL